MGDETSGTASSFHLRQQEKVKSRRGGRRPGAGRKKNPQTAAQTLSRRRMSAARGLAMYVLELRQLGAEPRKAVEAAARAAARIIEACRQAELFALDGEGDERR